MAGEANLMLRGRKARIHLAAPLLIAVLLCLRLATGQYINQLQGDVDFLCPAHQQSLTGVASVFDQSARDRRWQLTCGTGGGLANVSATCTLQPAVHELEAVIQYSCPNDGYLGGLQSSYSLQASDRLWRPYCCERPHSRLINCEEQAGWQNLLRGNLDVSLTSPFVFTGIVSHFDNLINDRRWRYRFCQLEVSCGDPGYPDNSQRTGTSFLYGDIVVYTCDNGYFQSSGPANGTRVCQETGIWSDTPPVCTACTPIESCADVRCSDAANQRCEECQSNQGLGIGEAAYRNLGNACEPLCSWLRSYCYPGNCSGHISTCECIEGFTGADCLEMTTAVQSFQCSSQLAQGGASVGGECTNDTTTTMFINFVPTLLNVEWSATFLGPASLPPRPAYVHDIATGVARSYVTAELRRASNPLSVVSTSQHECNTTTVSPDTPTPMAACHALASRGDLLRHTFLHGDTFTVSATAENGGYLDILNLDTSRIERQYYMGVAYVGVSEYTLDLMSPTHCEVDPDRICLINQPILNTGSAFSQEETNFTVSWGGWGDTPSGINQYLLEVYLLLDVGGVLMERTHPLIAAYSHTPTAQPSYRQEVALPGDGPYSFTLQVQDSAGNIQRARRLVLYDTNSTLETDPTHPLVVTSAVPASQYQWVNDTIRPLSVSGRSHFFNTNLRDSNWLAPVGDFMGGGVLTEYDHPLTTGDYPRNGTRNAQGVITLEYAVEVDAEGGASMTRPLVGWTFTDDIFLDDVSVPAARADGLSVRVWFRARDFKGNTLYDSTVVHVDSSAPEAHSLSLQHVGMPQLALLGSRYLTDLTAVFQAHDEHSGIYRITWTLGTAPGSADTGQGALPIATTNQSSCSPPGCVCDSLARCYTTSFRFSPAPSDLTALEARHDADYYLTVDVTNHARLTTTLTHRFTVDVTPPLEGVVFEGPVGSTNVDYQRQLEVSIWWMGFFDRETDILFYHLSVGSECRNNSYFTYPVVAQVTETVSSEAVWLAPNPGTYFATVVAYNSALRPSAAVCSNGITIDSSPPVFTRVSLPAMTPHPSQPISFVPYHTFFNLSWDASDNTGIREYQVAIATSADLLGSTPDILPSSSTGRLAFRTVYNASLVSGSTLFVMLTATDLAGNTATHTLGPVVMDTTPPVFEGNFTITSTANHVIVTWSGVNITDEEEGSEALEVEYAVGKSPYSSEIVPFTTASASPPCVEVDCVAVETTHLLNGEKYYITLSVINTLGLSSHSTQSFQHVTGPPSNGTVLDVVDFGSGTYRDVDVIIGSDPLFAVWEGLDHPFLPVNYSVAIGITSGGAEVFPLTPVGGVQYFEFTNTTLLPGSTYYILVLAESATGTAEAVSDGVFVLANEVDDVTMSAAVQVEDQLSTSVVRTSWDFPSLPPSLTSHHRVALYTAGSDNPLNTPRDTGVDSAAILSGLALNPQTDYRVGVMACHLDGCLPVIFSEVFSVHTPPELMMIKGVYSPKASLAVSWTASSTFGIESVQWTVGQDTYGGRILLPWQSVQDTSLNGSITVPAHPLDAVIDPQISTFITVRVTAGDGLRTQLTVPLKWQIEGEVLRQGDFPVDPPVVRDVQPGAFPTPTANSSNELEFFDADNIIDIDYTSHSNQLAATWPTMRFTKYTWSVAEQPSFLSCDQAIACGETFLNGITASGLDLEHGHTYFICIRVLPQDLIEVDTLPRIRQAMEVCSDGVLVLTSPPVPGSLTVVTDGAAANASSEWSVQASTSEIHLQWEEFTVAMTTYHATALSHYEYAIGSSPGTADIVPFTNVGVSQEALLTNLSLTPGLLYYATVRGVDLAGLSSQLSPSGFMSDWTPPFVASIWIKSPLANSVRRSEEINVYWTPIVEEESSVTMVTVKISSRRYPSVPATSTSLSAGTILRNIPLVKFIWAHITVRNSAGQSATYSSRGYYVEEDIDTGDSPVKDGLSLTDDVDYTCSTSSLSAIWTEQKLCRRYWISIGSFPGGRNVVKCKSVGIDLQATVNGLQLQNGQRYYVTVWHKRGKRCRKCRCCRGRRLLGSSNGVTVDTTPPVAGTVTVNNRCPRTCEWKGFHDPESNIKIYIVSAGYSRDGVELLNRKVVPARDESVLKVVLPPPNICEFSGKIYCSVTAVNNAGKESTAYSSLCLPFTFLDIWPFNIDVILPNFVRWITSIEDGLATPTPPLAGERPTPILTTAPPALVRNFTTTPLVYWEVVPVGPTHPPAPVRSVHSTTGVFSQLDFADGVSYHTLLTACTPAGICSSNSSEAVLLDSSPPIDGYFAVDTPSSANISRSVPGGMTWHNDPRGVLRLAWVGFSDPHTGVGVVQAAVGSAYLREDLSGGPQPIGSGGEGVGEVSLVRRLTPGESIFVTLSAVNNAGLSSKTVIGGFLVQQDTPTNGSLVLIRSHDCQLTSCMGHCPCSARGERCFVDPVTAASCQELSGQGVNVSVGLDEDLRWDTQELYTGNGNQLRAEWEVASTSVQWTEWTVVPPSQVPSSWYPGDSTNMAAYYPPASQLYHGSRHQFLVRMWFSFSEFSLSYSPVITVDLAGPTTAGRRVIEGAGSDVDFVSSSWVWVSWSGVFEPGVPGQELRFEVKLGTTPGGDDVISSLETMATSMNVTSSVLNASGRYFSSVTAVNSLGRMVTSVSDGFVYDPTPPTTGLLYVTQQNGSLDLRWEGFHDTESTLDHYEYAVSESGTQPSNSAFVDVGLRLSVGVTSPLAHGTQYTIHLRAVNRAGLPSEAAVAMVTGDSTPPIGINCSFDINLIVNPSFEGQASCAEQGGSLSSWEVEPGVVLVPVGDVVPADGCYSARVVGSLSQSIPTSPNTTYRLSFFTRARRNESLLAVDGTVEAEGVRQWVFAVQDTWSAVLLEFTAASEVTNITFKTNDDYSDGYLIDDVTVSSCQEMSRLDDVSDRVTWPEVFDVKQSHASSPSPALYVCWSIDDEESGLADWAFSVGTSPGGGQLLPFASTLERCAELQELDLPHGIEVFVGVKVTNRAGLTRLIHSNGYRIDLTPPTFVSGVQDGPGPVDIDYQQGSVLQAWWTAADEESNVVRCYASMGSAPGAADVRSLTDVGQAGNVTWTASLDVGRTVYTTVVCVNGAGLAATATSDGVTIATTPVISEAELLLESNSQDTLYRSTEGYFPSSDITARWRGFTDSTNSPLHYEFSLHDTSPAPWVGVGPLQQLVLYALPVPPGEGHTLEVRALNLADLTTAQLGGDVNVSAEEPSLTGIPINSTWVTSTQLLIVDWEGTFASSLPLHYEVSVGTSLGSGSVLSWMETELTSLAYQHPRLVSTEDYFVTVTAIAANGHSTTAWTMVHAVF